MKTKVLLVSLVFCTMMATKAYSFGLGAQFNFQAGRVFAPGAALVISPSRIVHLALNWHFPSDEDSIVGVTLDAAPLALPLSSFGAGTFNFTLGVGLFANLILADKPGFDGGIRFPVGFNILLGRRAFEIYTHVAPSFGFHLLPNMGLSDPHFPIALGARLWFR